MSWEASEEELNEPVVKKPVPVAEEKKESEPEEKKADEKPEGEQDEPTDDPKPEEKETAEPEATPEKEPEEKTVSQDVVGRVAKAIREKHKKAMAESQDEVARLRRENEELRIKQAEPAPEVDETDIKIAQQVELEYLKRQDRLGYEKYGQAYKDSIDLIASENDPRLIEKIKAAANPVEQVMKYGKIIAEEIELGSDPEERARKKTETMKAEIRKEVEAEFNTKLKAIKNQPTDVQNIRVAGGDAGPDETLDSWDSGKTSLRKK